MTTTVKVEAHCNPEITEVSVVTPQRSNEFLKDGESSEYFVHDNLTVSVMEVPITGSIPFKEHCSFLRREIERIGLGPKELVDVVGSYVQAESDQREMAANLMLAYRHLEDARMRLGKAIQAFDGGASVYKD